MAQYVGFESMDALVDATVPADIRRRDGMQMGEWTWPALGEPVPVHVQGDGEQEQGAQVYQGTGYYGTHVPTVILRNVLENQLVHQYTPYQAEIAQGRLESL